MWAAIVPVLEWVSYAVGAATIGGWFIDDKPAVVDSEGNEYNRPTFIQWYNSKSPFVRTLILVGFISAASIVTGKQIGRAHV